ncbi:MAG TPA: methylenetetrahydrofolate reductase [Actinomycetota bacterium]
MIGSRLEHILRSGHLAVTGEIGGPRSADGRAITASARAQVGCIDAVNVGDNAVARAEMSPVAGSALVVDAGLEPIMQLTTRDRNRLALTSDLLGGWALGARNLLCLGGDPMSSGEEPGTTEVRDLSVPELVHIAVRLREEARLPSGAEIESPPRYFVGVVDEPLIADYDIRHLEAKLDAGADFVQTQIAYDLEGVVEWADAVRPHGVFERASILVGVAPLRSLRMARWMNDHLPGVTVPEHLLGNLERAGEDEGSVGIQLTVDLIGQLRRIPGVAGIHLMCLGREETVGRVAEAAGLLPRPAVPEIATVPPGSGRGEQP